MQRSINSGRATQGWSSKSSNNIRGFKILCFVHPIPHLVFNSPKIFTINNLNLWKSWLRNWFSASRYNNLVEHKANFLCNFYQVIKQFLWRFDHFPVQKNQGWQNSYGKSKESVVSWSWKTARPKRGKTTQWRSSSNTLQGHTDIYKFCLLSLWISITPYGTILSHLIQAKDVTPRMTVRQWLHNSVHCPDSH